MKWIISKPVNVTISLMKANQESDIKKKIHVNEIIKRLYDPIKNLVPKLFEQFESIMADKN